MKTKQKVSGKHFCVFKMKNSQRIHSPPVVVNSPGIKMGKKRRQKGRRKEKHIGCVFKFFVCFSKTCFIYSVFVFRRIFTSCMLKGKAKAENGSRNRKFMQLLFLFLCFSCAFRGFIACANYSFHVT